MALNALYSFALWAAPTDEDGSFGSFGACELKCKRFGGQLLVCLPIFSTQVSAKGRHHLVYMAAGSAHSTSIQSADPLPIREIPGDYGLPLLGSLVHRLNYFWFQGREKFFSSLVEKYGSTVVRVNMPPGPPFFPDSRTVMLLDQKSYPVLFDMNKVEKKNLFVGTYMPSTEFYGGFRVLPFLDPSEEKHTSLKKFSFEVLRSNAKKWMPEFNTAFKEAAETWERQLSKTGSADFSGVCEQFTFNFLLRTVLGRNPSTPGEACLGNEGPSCALAWLALQVHPQTSVGLPKPLEEILLHTFPLPYVLVASQHRKLYRFFQTYGKEVFDMAADKFDIDRDEACHNLLFLIFFNTWSGILFLFPSIISRIAEAGPGLQMELAEEVRKAVKNNGGLNMSAINSMELVHSTIYEVLRIDPPAAFQYGRAKTDLIVESHHAAYKVQKGQLLGGYQGMAMKDPKVFKNPESFCAKRFMGDKGKQLLQYLIWSNGPECNQPTTADKQCAGKD
eukprot:c21715_g1_i1 orf=1-1509(-)